MFHPFVGRMCPSLHAGTVRAPLLGTESLPSFVRRLICCCASQCTRLRSPLCCPVACSACHAKLGGSVLCVHCPTGCPHGAAHRVGSSGCMCPHWCTGARLLQGLHATEATERLQPTPPPPGSHSAIKFKPFRRALRQRLQVGGWPSKPTDCWKARLCLCTGRRCCR